jgi:hypothetical protein
MRLAFLLEKMQESLASELLLPAVELVEEGLAVPARDFHL